MRYDQLSIDADVLAETDAERNTVTIGFHPQLTVIAGVGRLEREGLMNELVGALGSSRSGVHAELTTDSGRQMAIFRPARARHRVIDIDNAKDITPLFTTAGGDIDILAGAGLDTRTARRRIRVTSGDLTTRSQTDNILRRLSAIDPVELWSTAERVRITEDQLQAEAESVKVNAEDAEAVQRIEARHQTFVETKRRAELLRKMSFFCAAFGALAAVPLAKYGGTVTAMPVIMAAAVVTMLSFRQFKKLEEAEVAEREALKAAGAQSYLGFHLQRVNGLLANDQHRRRLMRAAEEHRQSLDLWKSLVGDVEVAWVLERRELIENMTRQRISFTQTAAMLAPDIQDVETADLAQTLIDRLTDARSLGPAGESLPLVIDDALRELPRASKPPLLELILRASKEQQIIFLTEDPEVSAWARLEAMTGELTVLEPAGAGGGTLANDFQPTT